MQEIRLTVGELRDMLARFDEMDEIAFGSAAGTPLQFHRMKGEDPHQIRIELAPPPPATALRLVHGER